MLDKKIRSRLKQSNSVDTNLHVGTPVGGFCHCLAVERHLLGHCVSLGLPQAATSAPLPTSQEQYPAGETAHEVIFIITTILDTR